MYPTVNSLMDLWSFVIAREIKVVKGCKAEIEAILRRSEPLTTSLSPPLGSIPAAFVRIVPDGDILPTRAKYSTESNDWQVAVNYVYADKDGSANQGLWISLPDVVASVILTGRIPEIVDAFRIEPRGRIEPGLKSTKLRGIDRDRPRSTKTSSKRSIEATETPTSSRA